MSNQRYRKHKSANREGKDASALSPLEQQFLQYQEQLDARHDKYERLVKLSRDITIDSKRVIFLLHRNAEQHVLVDEAKSKLAYIQSNAWFIVAEELLNEDPYQYTRAYSPGLQEYIEALSFCHYIEHGTLISLQEVRQTLKFCVSNEALEQKDTSGEGVPDSSVTAPRTLTVLVTLAEYILGIADFTGELMRLAINSVAAGKLDMPHKVCAMLRSIGSGLDLLGNTVHRDLSNKVNVLRDSVRKVETACYSLHIRGSEMPQHMLPNLFHDAGDDSLQTRCAGNIED